MTHEPRRPEWTCHHCGQPWPCPPARVELSESYGPDRVGLSVYMGVQLADATLEAPGEPREMWDRFVAWTR